MAVATKGVSVEMTLDKETPHTLRFREEPADDKPVAIGTLYVPKQTAKELGIEKTIRVTVERA